MGGVASVEAEATLPTWPWARLALWNGWPIRGHHVISKPSQNSGPDLYFGKEFGKAESSNATLVRDDDQIHAHK